MAWDAEGLTGQLTGDDVAGDGAGGRAFPRHAAEENAHGDRGGRVRRHRGHHHTGRYSGRAGRRDLG